MSSIPPKTAAETPEPPDALTKAAEVIPSFYYDIIARIIPGAATIVGVAWVLRRDVKPAGTDWIILAGAGYVVGLLLSVGSTVLVNLVTLLPGWHHRYSDRAIWRGIWQRRNHPDASIVVKMAAEATSAENLLVGGLVVLVTAFVGPTSNTTDAAAKAGLALLTIVLTVMVVLRRYFLHIRIITPQLEEEWSSQILVVHQALRHVCVIRAIRLVLRLRGTFVKADVIVAALDELGTRRA